MMDVEGVILAAGKSSRTVNVHKMELTLGTRTIIQKSVESMDEVCRRIVVVGGSQIHRIQELLKDYPKVEIVFNEQFKKGMFSSIKTGISRVRASSFFILPGDMPLIGKNIYRAMLDSLGDIVIPTYHGKKGHPVLFRRHHIREILDTPDDATLRDYIKQTGFSTVELGDKAILLDVDNMEDYAQAKEVYETGKNNL